MSLLSPGQPRVASPVPIMDSSTTTDASQDNVNHEADGQALSAADIAATSMSSSAAMDRKLHAAPRYSQDDQMRAPSSRRARSSIDSLSSSRSMPGSSEVPTIALPAAASVSNADASSDVPRYVLHTPITQQPNHIPVDARYVTVSSVLSRSGPALLVSAGGHGESSSSSSSHAHRRSQPQRKSMTRKLSSIDVPPQNDLSLSSTSKEQQRRAEKRASNGSALEALGALFLRRDSSGKVSNLSFMRHSHNDDATDAFGAHANDMGRNVPGNTKRAKRGGGGGGGGSARAAFSSSVSSVSRAWLDGLVGAKRLGISMPRSHDAGQTIAQRRARKTMLETNGDGQNRVGTHASEPTFEVAIKDPIYPDIPPQVHKKSQRSLEAQSDLLSPPPAPRLVGVHNDPMTPFDLQLDDDDVKQQSRPRTILREAPLSEPKYGVYGPGSAFSMIDPPELPPSPIGMPGAWMLGSGRWSRDRLEEEGALLLPPPLLDDNGSDAKSFEGLLGVRRMREQERARKQFEKLKARNRPAHKIGMLTAFSNFVKAAHAADRASRVATGNVRIPLKRRHTEPIETSAVTAAEDDGPSDAVIEEPSEAMHEPIAMRRSGSLRRTSMDSSGRQLDTVYEARSPEAAEDSDEMSWGEGELDDDEGVASPPHFTSSGRTSLNGIPFNRLQHIPVRMSSSTDDSTRLDSGLEGGSLQTLASPGSLSGPTTPRLGPTMLSLPPSPWTPHGGSSGLRSGQQTPFHVQLGMTPFSGPPGTPRLIPALLEVLPSPFPALDGSTPSLYSPVPPLHDSMTAPSPLALTPSDAPSRAATSTARRPAGAPRRRTAPSLSTAHDGRLTPSASMNMLSDENVATPKKRSMSKDTKPPSAGARTASAQRPANRRSFLLWFLFGDLGLGARSTIAAKASGSPTPTAAMRYSQAYNTLLFIAAHIYGFAVFVLAHLVDLGYRIAEFLSMTFWFVRWMTLNLTGQTVLARCAIDAYQIVAREWETVSKEDHEKRGTKPTRDSKKQHDIDDKKTLAYRGLSRWQVLKGLIELVCLQDVTRERYLHEGAGLEEIKGWRRRRRGQRGESDGNADVIVAENGPGRIDLGAMRAADRKAKDVRAARLVSARDSEEADDDDDDETGSESSDDDMVVTRRGADILEFTKTPKVETMHGYFSSSDDGDVPVHVRSRRGSQQRTWSGRSSSLQRRATSMQEEEPANRQTVKLIKWASRLAISAYGLHVTLVDLPATFTPSGDRFSRQTFAHLSRLHHEDVLHADIQTLDSDDYSPTFYLVRDLTRRVVAVSVRGTQSLQDIIVDLEMVVDQVKLHNEDLEKVSDEALFCHAGVLRAAQALIAPESTLFRTLNQALNEHPDFGIVFTGHSLGGAIASTVVLLLSRFEKASKVAAVEADARAEDEDGEWVTHDRSGLPAGRSIRAITFAHPATVSANLAERSSRGKTPLVLSVVLGHDIIPRCGHGQARELRRVLGALSRVRKRKEARSAMLEKRRHGRHPTRRRSSVSSINTNKTDNDEEDKTDIDDEDDFDENSKDNDDDEQDARVHIVTSWWQWRTIKRKGASASREEQLRAYRIEKELWRLRCDVENDLYSAVKRRTEEARRHAQTNDGATEETAGVGGSGGGGGSSDGNADDAGAVAAMVHSRGTAPSIPPSPWIGPSQRAKAPLHQLAARRQALDAVTLANEESISKSAGVLVPAGRSIWLYEGNLYRITSPLSFFSLPDFHARMFSEHFPSAYEDWLEKL